MKRVPILLAVLFSVVGVLAGSATAADAAPAATERLQSLDREILLRLNAARAARGLRPLALSNDLEEAAVAHSRSMLEGGFFAHDSRDGSPFTSRLKRFYSASGYSSWSAGENLLYNTAAIDAETALDAWLGSPAHRDNMLEPSWREVGIGSLHTSSAGGQFGGDPTWVITMDFGVRSGGDKAERQASAKAEKPRHKKPKHAKKPAQAKQAKQAEKAEKAARVEKPKPAEKAEKPKQTEKAEKAEKAKPAKPAKPEERSVDRVLPTPSGAGQSDPTIGSDDLDEGDDEQSDQGDDEGDEQGDDQGEDEDAAAGDDDALLLP